MTQVFFEKQSAFRKQILADVVALCGVNVTFDSYNDSQVHINEHGVVLVLNGRLGAKRLMADYPTDEMIELLEYLPERK